MSAEDDEIRRQLLAHGDDGRVARHTLFFFYEGDVEALEKVALSCDYTVRRMVENNGLILEKIISVDEPSFSGVSAMMESWAERFGAEYDGWECEVVGSD